MKWMIASDLHGSAYYTKALLDRFFEEKADRLLLLGDLLYHGPRNDLPREYAPKTVLALLNQMRERLLCVRGNCDCEVDQMVLQFPILADYAALRSKMPSFMQRTAMFSTSQVCRRFVRAIFCCTGIRMCRCAACMKIISVLTQAPSPFPRSKARIAI